MLAKIIVTAIAGGYLDSVFQWLTYYSLRYVVDQTTNHNSSVSLT